MSDSYEKQKHDKHSPTLIHIYDFRDDGRPNGQVVIAGRISKDDLSKMQDYLRSLPEQDIEVVEERAREWLNLHGWDIVYPLYWEQVYL